MITEKKREIGVSDELNFWKEFTSSNRFKENWCTTTPNPELNLDIEIFHWMANILLFHHPYLHSQYIM